ncbi:class A beta-lactamase [Sphingomonas colocasiae]|uniref:beta-lactamase n=1 Tax=Sphingomonas colocasiae TaxID=1848973 RepID=A0ABS7PVD0_9SPHN|nr:class A beta-lactamase [Sphingomonas colocasiae]MBY8825325.1 class A beta-lactamase [Sphingomonas colocasiae]
MRYNSALVAMAAMLAIASPAAAAAPAASKSIDVAQAKQRLVESFARLAQQTDGTTGVAIQRIGGGDVITLNAGTRFPMASTFKISVAGAIFSLIDSGKLTLDHMITVDPALVVPSDGIADQLPHRGVSLSVHNLLELMLTRSDNTATNVLSETVGGPAAVTAWLRSIGITGMQVDRDTRRIRPDGTPFDLVTSNNSTPEAMLNLLLAIRAGKAVSATSTKALIEIMERCHTGEARLKGLLPPGTMVAHKTGTLRDVANDVGFVTLPDGNQFAIAVFVKGDTKGPQTQERVIAEISRAAYDYFLLLGR